MKTTNKKNFLPPFTSYSKKPVGVRVKADSIKDFVERYYKKDRLYAEHEVLFALEEDYYNDGFVTISRYTSVTGQQIWCDFADE